MNITKFLIGTVALGAIVAMADHAPALKQAAIKAAPVQVAGLHIWPQQNVAHTAAPVQVAGLHIWPQQNVAHAAAPVQVAGLHIWPQQNVA